MPTVRTLVTCEHAGRRVPLRYRRSFRGAGEALRSHRGWDSGAADVAERLAGVLSAPLIAHTITRLLVDVNRSLGTPTLHSEFTRDLSEAERQRILDRYYHPYRGAVERAVADAAHAGEPLLHLSIHSFTPVLNGVRRELEVGLLYDPSRARESRLCGAWVEALAREASPWRVRHNEPYLGTDDGLTTHLRTLQGDAVYAGIEVEVRSDLIGEAGEARRVADLLARTLREVGP